MLVQLCILRAGSHLGSVILQAEGEKMLTQPLALTALTDELHDSRCLTGVWPGAQSGIRVTVLEKEGQLASPVSSPKYQNTFSWLTHVCLCLDWGTVESPSQGQRLSTLHGREQIDACFSCLWQFCTQAVELR